MSITEWTEETIREHMFTEVEVSDNGHEWYRRHLIMFDKFDHSTPFTDADRDDWKYMRLIPKPKTRLMTIKELWWKTLISRNGCLVTVNKVDSHNQINMLDSWITVAEAHLDDFKVAGPDLDYETATSLEVEE
jgi:hypothetical protein